MNERTSVEEYMAEALFEADGRDDWGAANDYERAEYLDKANFVIIRLKMVGIL